MRAEKETSASVGFDREGLFVTAAKTPSARLQVRLTPKLLQDIRKEVGESGDASTFLRGLAEREFAARRSGGEVSVLDRDEALGLQTYRVLHERAPQTLGALFHLTMVAISSPGQRERIEALAAELGWIAPDSSR